MIYTFLPFCNAAKRLHEDRKGSLFWVGKGAPKRAEIKLSKCLNNNKKGRVLRAGSKAIGSNSK